MKHFLHNFLVLVGCLVFSSSLLAQEKEVTGVISDEQGVPLPGVNVIVQGSSRGTQSNFDGEYSIQAAPGEVLVFSFIGTKTIERTVGADNIYDVIMEESSAALDEVVVVGYGTTSRRDVTGAIASITGEDLAAVPVPDAAQALQGRLPGVNVTTQDGRPGADIAIRVRGGGSISQSNEPLFIVDGFPVGSISNIPGSLIESIDVLKDASSTAIYGARGANGVVIITTKGGKLGKTVVKYDGYGQYSHIPEYVPVMDAYDYIAYNWAYADAVGTQYRDAWERLWLIGPQNGSNSEGIDYYRNVDSRNYNEELYNSAFTQNHNLSISSGNENTRYLLSLNHLDQEGNKVGSGYERTNLSLNLDQKLGDRLDFTVNTRFSQEKELDNSGNSTGYYFRPIDRNDVLGDLDVTSNTQLGDYNSILQDAFNPISILNDNFNLNTKRSLIANSSLSWEIINGLTARSDLGLGTNWNRAKIWTGAYANNYIDPSTQERTFGGDARLVSSEGWNLRWANTLTYEVNGLGENHELTILAGMEVLDSGSETIDARGVQYDKAYDAKRAFANLRDYDATKADQNFFQSSVSPANRLNSYFGRVSYSLLDRYLFTGTFRADGSSRFAPSNRWGYFPAGAVAWRASEEAFLEDVSWVDDLKVRLAYGSVGSDAISSELWKQNWASGVGTYSINEMLQPNYAPASALLANPDLKWETTITRNLGIDFSILNRRISGTIELYKNTVKDLLLVSPVSGLTGFEYTQENIGSTSNKGIEILLNAMLVTSEDFNLNASFNINFNRGRIEELAEGVNNSYGSDWGGVAQNPREDYAFEVGRPVGLIRGYTHDGWYTTDDFNYDPDTEVYTLKDGVPDYASGVLGFVYGTVQNKPGDQTAYPGVQKAVDYNGDDLINDEDIRIIGDTNPDHTGGFSLSGNYKAMDFGFNFNWSVGNDIYNATHQQAYLGNKEAGLYRNRLQELSGHYKIYDIVDGQLTSIVDPAALDALNANATTHLPYPESTIVSTFAIEDGSFLRLNTATIGYTLSNSVSNTLGINNFRVYGTIYNAFVLTNYSGFDPEVSADNSRSEFYPTPGLDFGSYPRSRTYTLGINVEF